MMAANNATTAQKKSTDTPSSSKPKKKKAELEMVPECKHSVFQFTPKRTSQICVRCKSARRIYFKKDHTATVGPWCEAKG